MAVQLRSSGGFGVVAVYDLHIVQSNSAIEMEKRLIDALFADDVVAGNVRVAGIDAGCNWYDAAEAVDHLGDLLEAASEGKVGAGGGFDQGGQSKFMPVKALRGGSEWSNSRRQA